jgi:glycosyltransferase involved in cell wall biosynthesis
MAKEDEIAVVIPTKNRRELLLKAINQYPQSFHIIVVDATKNPSLGTKEIRENIEYYFTPNLPLHHSRNLGIEVAKQAGRKYVLQTDDDSFFKNPKDGVMKMAEILESYSYVWAVGGMGAYRKGWLTKKYYGKVPHYSTWASGAYGMMIRSNNSIRFKIPRREDLQYSLDCWINGGRVVLHPDVVVDHLDYRIGGTEEKWDPPKRYTWYSKYIDELQKLYGEIPFIKIRRDGVVYVMFWKLGIKNKILGAEEPTPIKKRVISQNG